MSREVSVILPNPLGLHARAAGKIVQIASRSAAKIQIERPSKGRSADAGSILELMSLGAKQGSTVIVRSFADNDEVELNEIVDLIKKGFDEV